MSRSIELRKALLDIFDSLGVRAYYQTKGTEEPAAPYVIFDLPSSVDDGNIETFRLEVDGWDLDNAADTTDLETLMATVDGDGDLSDPSGLHRRVINLATIQAVIYNDGKLSLEDPDSRVKRRQYTYQVQVF